MQGRLINLDSLMTYVECGIQLYVKKAVSRNERDERNVTLSD